MKAADLMIGDWVLKLEVGGHYRKCRIKAIFDDGIVDCVTSDGEVHTLSVLGIEPIPLTADILKTNGIELFAVGDNGVATPPKWRNRLEQWLIRTKWKDTNLWYDRMTKKYRLQDTNAIEIEYVHQLQQTLRLAKIEKEIVI